MSSRKYKEKKMIVWPNNIDATVSRSFGRKISKDKSVVKPKIEEILKASEELGLEPSLEEKKYPKQWWSVQKRVVVLKKYGKIQTLEKISQKIKEIRKQVKRM